jgi:hypothetical protein
MESFRIWAFLLLFAGVGALLTWGISFIKVKWLKYVPGAASLGATIYQLIMANRGSGEGFDDLARLLMSFLLLAFAIGALVTAVVVDRVFSKRRT